MPCRTTSALIGKSYIAADQAGMALHMMAILQAYQADVLKEMDEGTGLTPEAVKELRRATDLALRATKHTARVGPSMAGSVAAERHLWLDFTEIREKEKVFLLDAPISQSGLFGEAVSSVVEKFRSAKTQSDDLKQFMPRSNPYPERSLLAGAAPKLCILPRPRSGEPVAGLFLANDRADGLTWSSPADLPLRLLRVVPDPRVGMRRASSSLRGETRPQNHICPPQTRSPHSDLSYPPLEVWCAEKVQHQFSLVWQLGDALGLPPLPSVLLPPADCMIRDTIGSLLQRTSFSPVLHSSSSQTRGFPSWNRPKGCIFPHPGRPATQEVPSVCLWMEGLPIQGPSLRPGLGTENVHKVHGYCTGPLEVPGHSCSELLRQLAHSGPLQGVSESSQRYRSPPHSFSWPQNERQEECSLPLLANCIFGGSLGFHSDAGPFGSCPDIQFYSMSGPLQARPSCLSEYLPQVARPHGSGLPCVAPRVASHEAVPFVDERAETTSHDTSHSPNQGVAQLLSAPFTMAGHRFPPKWGQNRCDSPSPYDHDGRINDRLGRGLRRQTGAQGMDRRVRFLAHKLPGTQNCLPGFDAFSPRFWEASYNNQNGQYGGSVPHKPSGGFTAVHPG